MSQAQCTKASQLPTALGLVADMRRRGIPINNHTYCALLSVCLKANELDLALNIFQQLQLEGVTPSIVTYNIILEVYAKQGMWQQALQTVTALNSQVCGLSKKVVKGLLLTLLALLAGIVSYTSKSLVGGTVKCCINHQGEEKNIISCWICKYGILFWQYIVWQGCIFHKLIV